MLTRSTIIILLNQTNKEPVLDPHSQLLVYSVWMSDMGPPISIFAGEYGVWASESATQMDGNKGSLQYLISELDLNDPIVGRIHILEATAVNQ
jgi:hypothetical protein